MRILRGPGYEEGVDANADSIFEISTPGALELGYDGEEMYDSDNAFESDSYDEDPEDDIQEAEDAKIFIDEAKRLVPWTVDDARRFLASAYIGLNNEHIIELSSVLFTGWDLPAIRLFYNEFIDDPVGLANLVATIRESEGDQELYTIFGLGEEALPKLVELTNLWKNEKDLNIESLALFVSAGMCSWYAFDDDILISFIEQLTRTWTPKDVNQFLTFLNRDGDGDEFWEEEWDSGVETFFSKITKSWPVDRKRLLVKHITQHWGWERKTIVSLHRSLNVPLEPQAGKTKGKKKNNNNNKNKKNNVPNTAPPKQQPKQTKSPQKPPKNKGKQTAQNKPAAGQNKKTSKQGGIPKEFDFIDDSFDEEFDMDDPMVQLMAQMLNEMDDTGYAERGSKNRRRGAL